MGFQTEPHIYIYIYIHICIYIYREPSEAGEPWGIICVGTRHVGEKLESCFFGVRRTPHWQVPRRCPEKIILVEEVVQTLSATPPPNNPQLVYFNPLQSNPSPVQSSKFRYWCQRKGSATLHVSLQNQSLDSSGQATKKTYEQTGKDYNITLVALLRASIEFDSDVGWPLGHWTLCRRLVALCNKKNKKTSRLLRAGATFWCLWKEGCHHYHSSRLYQPFWRLTSVSGANHPQKINEHFIVAVLCCT